jgi:acetylornithine deacetylase/succinyl-diaminopimelate desuccinylase-like protein
MLHRFAAPLLGALLFCGAAYAQTPSPAERTQALEIYRRVVGFDTSITGGQTPAMANYLAERFRAGGFAAEDVHMLPLENTAGLVVRYRGNGAGGRPIVLLAHMDVVPALRTEWERDPFTLVEENGMFFGRGSLDNKAGLTQLASLFLTLKAEGFTPTRDLILWFSGDEETSASVPRDDNAIYALTDALTRLRAFVFPVMWNETTILSFRNAASSTSGAEANALRRFADNPGDRVAARALSRSPGLSAMLRTTCVATMLSGGHAENALPQTATATVNCRIFPGVAVADIESELRAIAGPQVEVALIAPANSSEASPLRPDVMEATARAVRVFHPEAVITPYMSAGATDGLFFRAAGIPTYGVGGIFMRGEDDFAHGLNERVPVDTFYNGLTHWRVLLTALAGPR